MIDNNTGMTSLNKTRSTEWMLACCAIIWGWAVLQPEQSPLPAYKVMNEILRESLWGAIAVLIGSIRMVGLVINGFWRRSPIIRGLGSFTSGFLWMLLAVFNFAVSHKAGSPVAPGAYFYLIFFGFEGWCLAAASYDMQKCGSLSVRGK